MTVDQILDAGYAVGMHQHRDELGALLALLQSRPRCRTVLEIGTLHGGTTICWASLPGMERVVTVDLPTGDFGGAAHGYGDAEKRDRRRQRLQDHGGIRLIEGDSHDPDVMEQVAAYAQTFDFLFIDGDHSLSGVAADYEIYRRFVRPGGLIAFHDINETSFHHDAGCYVDVFWNHLIYRGDYPGQHWTFSIGANWGGIGCLEVLP